jgi:ribosomal protein S18 acetylase RimI-like enzyme
VSSVRVVRVGEANWQTYRDVRLAMLGDSPRSFGSTLAETSRRSDEDWRAFATSAWLWLAYAAEPVPEDAQLDGAVGSIGMYPDPELPSGSTYLVGMWVRPARRGTGVAEALVRQVVDAAYDQGFDRIVLEVADENARGVAFYARMGFTPTGVTGTIPWDETITETQMERRIR